MLMMLTLAYKVQTTHQTAHGQLLDITTAPIGTVDLSKYTEETYIRIVTFKTAFYSFYLPVVCGLLVGGVTSQEAFSAAKAICIKMGQYFQAGCRKTLCAFLISRQRVLMYFISMAYSDECEGLANLSVRVPCQREHHRPVKLVWVEQHAGGICRFRMTTWIAMETQR